MTPAIKVTVARKLGTRNLTASTKAAPNTSGNAATPARASAPSHRTERAGRPPGTAASPLSADEGLRRLKGRPDQSNRATRRHQQTRAGRQSGDGYETPRSQSRSLDAVSQVGDAHFSYSVLKLSDGISLPIGPGTQVTHRQTAANSNVAARIRDHTCFCRNAYKRVTTVSFVCLPGEPRPQDRDDDVSVRAQVAPSPGA
jgi:hypothetical protein